MIWKCWYSKNGHYNFSFHIFYRFTYLFFSNDGVKVSDKESDDKKDKCMSGELKEVENEVKVK